MLEVLTSDLVANEDNNDSSSSSSVSFNSKTANTFDCSSSFSLGKSNSFSVPKIVAEGFDGTEPSKPKVFIAINS